MGNLKSVAARRGAAKELLNRLTFGIAFAAVAGVGVLSNVAAQTIPGTSSSTQSANATTSSSSANASLQGSSSTVTSSSGTAVAVSGGSH